MRIRGVMVSVAGLAAVAGTALPLAAQVGGAPAVQEKSAAAFDAAEKLPSDPSLVTGTLHNGLKYIIKKHSNPPGRVSVWMQVGAGSLDESEAQRGVAHFLEHMAFNGSENFPPGAVVPFFESLGLTFGQHQNAFTSFNQTVYQLSLPNVEQAVLDQALLFFSDVAGRLTLSQEEIEQERQVILEEKTSRKSGQQRVAERVLERMMPGSLVPRRLPIGVEETIRGMSRADFEAFYKRFYVPSNITMMVVGDIDPKLVEDRITAAFSGFEEPGDAGARQDLGVAPYESSFAAVETDPELARGTVAIRRVFEPRGATDTLGELRREVVEQLATAALNRRFEKMVAESEAPFLAAGSSVSELAQAVGMVEVGAAVEPGAWEESLRSVAAEVQRARLHGFTAQEIDDVRRELIASLERRVSTESTVNARSVLGMMNSAVESGEPILSAQQRLEAVQKVLPTITGEDIASAFREMFDFEKAMYLVQLPANAAQIPSEADLLEIGKSAIAAEPEAITEEARAASLMETLPEPGTLVTGAVHLDTEIWTGSFSNNATVHHRFMDAKEDSITVVINLYGAALFETAENRGVTEAAVLALRQPATDELSSIDIRALMTGKKIRVGGDAAADSVAVRISGSPTDLEDGLKLAHLLLTRPKIEQSAFDQWKTVTLQAIEAREKNPGQMFAKIASEALFPPDPRTQPLTRAQVEALTLEAAQAWLERIIRESPMEIAVVGEMDREVVVPMIGRYLGSLPERPAVTAGMFAELRQLEKPGMPIRVIEEIQTQTPMAVVMAGFFGPDQGNLEDVRRLEIGTRILSTRMLQEIREKAQLVYGIGASVRPGTTFPGFGVVQAASTTQPEKTEALVAKILEMYAAFGETPITMQELDVAKSQTINAILEAKNEPGYWVSRMATMRYDGMSPDEIGRTEQAIKAMSVDEVMAAYRKYYDAEKTFVVVVKPGA